VEQSSGAVCYLGDEALKKEKVKSLLFSLFAVFSFLIIIFDGQRQTISPCQPCRVVGRVGEPLFMTSIVAYMEFIVITAKRLP